MHWAQMKLCSYKPYSFLLSVPLCLNQLIPMLSLNCFHSDPPSSAPEGIDILIGSDYYWNFVSDEVIRIEGGSTVVKSTLG